MDQTGVKLVSTSYTMIWFTHRFYEMVHLQPLLKVYYYYYYYYYYTNSAHQTLYSKSNSTCWHLEVWMTTQQSRGVVVDMDCRSVSLCWSSGKWGAISNWLACCESLREVTPGREEGGGCSVLSSYFILLYIMSSHKLFHQKAVWKYRSTLTTCKLIALCKLHAHCILWYQHRKLIFNSWCMISRPYLVLSESYLVFFFKIFLNANVLIWNRTNIK